MSVRPNTVGVTAVVGSAGVQALRQSHHAAHQERITVLTPLPRCRCSSSAARLLTACEADADWEALDHFDVVARRILRWQQAVAGAAGPGDVEDVSVIGAAVGVAE